LHEPISPPPRRRRFFSILVALGVVLALVAVLQNWNTSQYALTPGESTPVAQLVKIHGLATDPHADKIMLTDVYLSSLSAWQWLVMHFQSHVEFVSASQLVDPGVPTDELSAQGFLQMSDSKQAAEAAALGVLGWKLTAVGTGAVINAVVAPSPARAGGLRVADEIVAVDGVPVRSTCDLIGSVHSLAPGSVVRLSVERARISAKGVISWARARPLSLTTAVAPKGLSASGCAGVTGPDHSWLGLSLESGVHYDFPGTVTIDTNNIGGPSAGLAMTLTLIDQLSAGSLTGHRVVAATGTIDARGNVGDVGGVAEKTVAVERAGASIFFVPEVEVATARSAAQPGLRIVGVSNVSQVLAVLRAGGGAKPVALTKPR
jgi:PDZ domain-containing protein